MMDKYSGYGVKCYICDEKLLISGKDIFKCSTNHSKTAIHELLEKFVGHELIRTSDTCFGCLNCIQKINEYDLACVTAEQVQKSLTDLLHQKEQKYLQKVELLCDDEYISVKDEISKIEKVEEDTDEYEVHFFTSETDTRDGEYKIYTEECEYKIYADFTESNGNSDTQASTTTTNIILEPQTTKRKSNPHCSTCNTSFQSMPELREHCKQKHESGERLMCDICGVSYKTRSALNIHVDLHNGISPFECDVCGKKFTQKGALKRHKPIHTGERPYQCDKCGKQFIHYSSFHMHNLAHDDVRDKKCEVCGLLLRSTSHLNRHMLVHTGQKPHACPKCGQRFAQRYNMMSHLRSHQGIHRKKKHVCTICKRGFAKDVSLQEHINSKVCSPSETTEMTLFQQIVIEEQPEVTNE